MELPDDDLDSPDWLGPKHISFVLRRSYVERTGWRPYEAEPRIDFFKVADFITSAPSTSQTLNRLTLLILNPQRTLEGEVPVLPRNGRQLFQSRLKPITAPGAVSGLRFLTAITQDETEVSNQRLRYVFSGLSHDRSVYVVSHFPVFVPACLHERWVRGFKLVASAGPNDFDENYRSYLAEVGGSMASLSESDFHPALDDLDALVRSVQVRSKD
jgi:hypothetical protein